MVKAPDIPGAADVVAWFGYWPSFHGAEVLSILLDRSAGAQVAIHAFEMTADLDAGGHYVLAKHAVVTFYAEGFARDTKNRIESFNRQNILSGAWINRLPEGLELVLEGIYGVEGVIVSARIGVKIQPGRPAA